VSGDEQAAIQPPNPEQEMWERQESKLACSSHQQIATGRAGPAALHSSKSVTFSGSMTMSNRERFRLPFSATDCSIDVCVPDKHLLTQTPLSLARTMLRKVSDRPIGNDDSIFISPSFVVHCNWLQCHPRVEPATLEQPRNAFAGFAASCVAPRATDSLGVRATVVGSEC
jgi:hypothetical protein